MIIPSPATIAFGLGVAVSASFVLQLTNFFVEIFGEEAFKLVFVCLCLLVAALYTLHIARERMHILGVAVSLIVFLLAFLLMKRQLFFAEITHVLEYGVLGYLASRDLFRTTREISKGIVWVALFVACISLLDEGFQMVLPYRVFELRDITTNVVGGFLGIAQYKVYYHNTLPRT